MPHETIDAHGHVWTTPAEYDWVDPVMPPGVERLVYSVDNYREEMATLGIDRAILVATPIHGPGSPYTVANVIENPDTFYGIVLVDYDAPDMHNHLESVLAHDNLLGVRMTADDLATAPPMFWEWMNNHGKQVHLLLSPDKLTHAAEYVANYPDIDFVFDHLGLYPNANGFGPDEEPYSTMETFAEHDNAYVKITHTPSSEPYPFPDIHEFVRKLLATFGPKRLLWGSDYIYHFKRVTPRHTQAFLDELPFLSDRDRRNLLGGTVRDRLL